MLFRLKDLSMHANEFVGNFRPMDDDGVPPIFNELSDLNFQFTTQS